MPTHSNTIDEMVIAAPVLPQQPMSLPPLASHVVEHDNNTSSSDPNATSYHCMTSIQLAIDASAKFFQDCIHYKIQYIWRFFAILFLNSNEILSKQISFIYLAYCCHQ